MQVRHRAHFAARLMPQYGSSSTYDGATGTTVRRDRQQRRIVDGLLTA